MNVIENGGRVNLTPERIRDFPCPPGKQQAFLWDSKSPRLAVRATAKGAKSFIFQSSLRGRTIRITIGDVVVWVIDKARKEANHLQTLIDKGIDPREQAREEREAKAAQKAAEKAQQAAEFAAKREAEIQAKYTLRALCEAYGDYLTTKGKKASAASARSLFRCHVYSSELADKAAKDLEDEELSDLIRAVNEAGKSRTAGVLRSYLGAAYQVALQSRLNPELPVNFKAFNVRFNPIRAIKAIPVKARKRDLSNDELKGYVEALGDDLVDKSLKVALYAGGQRMIQLLRATPADWDGKCLRLFDPKGKRKEPREHLLPLAPKAAQIIDDLYKEAKSSNKRFLFSTFGKVALSTFTAGKRCAQICAGMNVEPFDLRDIRRTCETMLAKKKITKEVRAHLLSHGLGGVQDIHYDKHDYMDEKSAALSIWEAHLAELTGEKQPSKIVNLRG
jgi:integrase